ARRVLHPHGALPRHLLRRAHRPRGPPRDVRAHVPRGPRLRLDDGARGRGRPARGRGVDVQLRREQRRPAELRPQGPLPGNEHLRARRREDRRLPGVLRRGRGAPPARLRPRVAREGPAPEARGARRFDYHGQPLEPALAVVEAVRANTVALLRRLPEAAWVREGRHTESGRYTAEDWLAIYADHLEGHARQIETNVELWQAAQRR